MRDNWFLYLIAVLLGGGIAAGLYLTSDNTNVAEVPFAQSTSASTEIIPVELSPVSEPQPAPVEEATPVEPAQAEPAVEVTAADEIPTDQAEQTGPSDQPTQSDDQTVETASLQSEPASPETVDPAPAETVVADPVEPTAEASEPTTPEEPAAEEPTEVEPETAAPEVETPPVESASDKSAGTATVTGTNLLIEGQKPQFDLVRVDQAGSAIVAGTAVPFSTVSIMSDGEKIGEGTANASGEFVILLDTDTSKYQNIELESEIGGQLSFSDESILILPSIGREAAEHVAEESSPTIVRATPDEVVIIQSGGQELVEQIVIDSISYDEGGTKVNVAGRGAPQNEVFLYVNNTPVSNTMIDETGIWKITLNDIDVGIYTMRADELDASGNVISRMETPFQRAYPADVQAAQTTSAPTHVVQPGNTLWLIAANNYGNGTQYFQIFEANRDKIRNPDLIYPGQVFSIPDAE